MFPVRSLSFMALRCEYCSETEMCNFLLSKHTVRNNSEKETNLTSSSRDELRVVTEALSVVLR